MKRKADFTLADLQKIVIEVGAPPLVESFSSMAVAGHVSALINNSRIKRPEKNKKFEDYKAALAFLERELPSRIKAQQRSLDELNAFYLRENGIDFLVSPTGKSHAKQLEQLAALSEAVAAVRSWPGLSVRKQGGHEGRLNYQAAEQLRQRLYLAWEEAGAPLKHGIKTKANQIIQKSFALTGIHVEVETVRRRGAKVAGK